MLDIITPDWPAPSNIRAAFTTRTGGVSAGPHASLNLGSRVGDSAEAVAENRRRLSEHLKLPAEPAWIEQVHGSAVVDVDRLSADSPARTDGPVGDAAVAVRSGRVCVICVADCLPVLFAARDGSAVGAAHAGWRGLAAGVLDSTVRELGEPSRLIAWMGPAIGPRAFEVGEDVRDAFLRGESIRASAGEADSGAGLAAEYPDIAAAFVRNARGRWQCDLYALARRRLLDLGVGGIYGGGWCTFTDPGRFFSYRRDGQCGRMAAMIWKT